MIAQFGFMSLSSVWHRLIPATLHNKHTARVCGFFNVFYMFCANKLAFFYFTCSSSAPYFVVNWWRQNCWTQRLFLILLVSLVDVPDYKSLFIIWTRGQQSSTACCQTNCVLGDLFISRVLYIRTLTPVPTSMRPSVWRRLFNAQSAQINNISSANYTLCFMICFIWLLSSSLDFFKIWNVTRNILR